MYNDEIRELIVESYECGDISLEEANILMEAVDDEVSKLDDKASKQAKSIKQINDKFVSSYKQASKAYKVYVKEIKGLIKRREYDDARKTIGKAKRQLQDILTIVKIRLQRYLPLLLVDVMAL